MSAGPIFEWRINLGTVIETCVLGFPVIWASLKMYFMLREHPPHSHTNMSDGKRSRVIDGTLVTYSHDK